MNAVEIRNATKTFGPHVAVDGLSLDVPAGTIYGFIGPNGSGKTTTLRMIMRIIHPDRGQIRVLGEDAHAGGAAHDDVGYLPEERGLYKQMRVADLLHFYAQLKGRRATRFEIEEWLERMFPEQGKGRVGQLKVEQLSKGMSQKVQYIATVIARPRLVLLDEPFSGLDPVNEVVLRQAVLDLRKTGTTVIFSTHNMATAERMCDFIFMIYKGKKVLDGTLESIQRTYGTDIVRVKLEENGHPAGAGRLEDLPGVVQVTDFGKLQELRLAPHADRQALLAALMGRGRVAHFEQAHPSLEDIFRRIAAPDGTDAAELDAAKKEQVLA
jgi:ABC-2 type transport system ATP-binding protein